MSAPAAGRLSGRAALVTGAARGIGAATVVKLATEGAHVLACDLDPEPLAVVARAIREAGGEAAEMVADVTDPGFGERAVERLLAEYGAIDILVNNAGYIWNTTIQNMSDEQWQAMVDVHATSTFRVLRAAAPWLRDANRREREAGTVRHRKVVNVSSISGAYGAATQVAYAAAKASVIGLTKSLAKEWGRYAVNVNSVAFGYIDTRLTQPWEGDEAATIEISGRRHKVGFPQRVVDALEPAIPLQRRGTPQEAAGAIYILCLPEADYISGEVLVCGGGAVG